MTEHERLEMAFGNAPDPEVSVTVGNELSISDMRQQIERDRKHGMSDHVSRRAFTGSSASPAAVQHARQRLGELAGNAEWGAKLLAGDSATVEEFRLLSEDARGRDGPNWSTPVPGAPTA